jgi:hypothetical protein
MFVERFSVAGFEQELLASVEQVTAPDMRTYIAMIKMGLWRPQRVTE